MAYANGRVPVTALKNLGSFSLLASVAQAYLNMSLIARLDKKESIEPAGPYGSGYRDLATQRVFWDAAGGDKNAMRIAHLDNNSSIAVAAPGYSSHGTGDRVDILFNGHSPYEADLELAKRYGFTREFGSSDPNHFQHDRRTAISGVRGFDKIRLTARFLNDRHLGNNTAAEHTGERDKAFIWLVQHYGHMQNIYPANCLEDGETGHYTEVAFDRIWNTLRDS